MERFLAKTPFGAAFSAERGHWRSCPWKSQLMTGLYIHRGFF